MIEENGRSSRSADVRLELERFSQNAAHNLRSLHARLKARSFVFAKTKGVPIDKLDAQGKKTGKFRPIVLAPVESRIVQRAVLNVLLDVPALMPYIKSPYSFGGMRKARAFGPAGTPVHRADNPAAVPAAIKAVLASIALGGRYFASADIRSFFTKISKATVTEIVSSCVKDDDFLSLFSEAIRVELENLEKLRDKAQDFPIEDIGVAQGNSLSPLLGNIVLANFDQVTNSDDCRCVRYIDDFIIIGPTARAVNAKLRLATEELSGLGMELSPEKSSKGARPVDDGFDFLGINVSPGLIRPSAKSQERLLEAIQTQFSESTKAFRTFGSGGELDRSRSLLATLKRVDGMLEGWGKHYWFCNDNQLFGTLDNKVQSKIKSYLGQYSEERSKSTNGKARTLLGVTELLGIPREPFDYPKVRKQP